MAMRFQMHSWSSDFLELLNNNSRSLNIQDYEFCLREWKGAHENTMVISYLLALLFCCTGLWAVWENSIFVAVLLLVLAAVFKQHSDRSMLLYQLMETQLLQAMLINRQSLDIEALRGQLVRPDESASAL